MSTTPETKLLTADEFDELPEPEDGSKLELDEGVVVVERPAPEDEDVMVTFEHGELQTAIASALYGFTGPRSLGRVVVESHFRFRAGGDRDIVRGPDVAFIRKDRLPDRSRRTRGSVPLAPDLAVEVVSPSDRDEKTHRKVRQYLDAGSQRVWVVRPGDRSIMVYRQGGDAHLYRDGDTLTSEDAAFDAEGFRLQLSELFDSVA